MGEVRHILATKDITPKMVARTIERADQLRDPSGEALEESRELLKKKKAGGMAVYVAMFEPSTRTADAHIRAAFQLGLDVRNRDTTQTTSLVKGETKRDMIMNIVAQSYDAVVIRDKAINTPRMASEVSKVPIINAGNGWDDHPTQALKDVYTIWREFGTTGGLKVVIAGDNYLGRVNRADARLLSRLGNKLIFASIPGLEIQDDLRYTLTDSGADFEETGSLIEAMGAKPDVVILSRFQAERYSGENFRTGEPWDPEEIARLFAKRCAATPKVMRAMKRDARLLHPLPRGPELPDDNDERVVIWSQVENGLWTCVANYEYVFGVGMFENEQTA